MKPNPKRLARVPRAPQRKHAHSSVAKLGAEGRLAELLDVSPALTYEEIKAKLREEGFDLSRSAIGRWSIEYRATRKALREAIQEAEGLTEGNAHHSILRLEEANASILQSQLLKHLQTKRGVDKETLEIAYAISALTASASQRERVRLAREKAIRIAVARIKVEIKRELEKSPALVAQLHKVADAVETSLLESEGARA